MRLSKEREYEVRLECDRREFLGIGAAVAAGMLLPGAFAERVEEHGSPDAEVTLKVTGNAAMGYQVCMLCGGKAVTAEDGDEISAVFQNGERSITEHVERWKATSWTGNDKHVTLKGDVYLPQSRATIYMEASYNVVARNIVRKRIRLRQSDMFMLFCQVSNRVKPAAAPAKFWSFDQQTCAGGALREYFPSAGFRTTDDVTVGVLTDAGFRNNWSRMFRRDGKPIKPAAAEIPDPNLYVVSSPEERNRGDFYVQQTFGEELFELPAIVPRMPVKIAAEQEWVRKGAPEVKRAGGILEMSAASPDDGLWIRFEAEAGAIYQVECEYRSNTEVSAAILDVDDHLNQVQNFNLFNDRMPASVTTWATFRSTVFVPTLQGTGAALLISLPGATPGGGDKIEIRSIRLSRVTTGARPYHRLEMGKPLDRTVFLFASTHVPDTTRGYRLASELHLSNALGFKGGETEKALYADLMMLCWNNGTQSFRPMLAPSIWYSAAGEMYLRDSFFALNGIHNRALNEQVFNLWGENQGDDGAINTLVEPQMANLERKSNDSTPLWLIWALRNRQRFGISGPAEKIKRAAGYCLRTYDPKGDGECIAQYVMGQLDIVSYPQGTSDLSQNQGMLAVTLRVIRALDIPGLSKGISDAHINRAEKLYRTYYDPMRKFIQPGRTIKDAIGFASVFPEYLSLWLFGRKMLTDEMMTNHLDRIPVMLPRAGAPFPELGGTVRPVFIGLDREGWRYFTESWHPMASDSYAESYAGHAMDGVYYNGGSWMRIEICGYIAGKLHGWMKAEKAIKNRLWAEINIDPDFPTSQEYLPTNPKNPFYGSHRVFAWNSFVLGALEQVGLRSPEMDPDYRT